ncbi:ATP-binding protein [Xanthovirga aplysinae]|uniref:ATP-binding protein n=1 Tax=Xanthovirga aplysinae TaxID=2529853 RepID=UPI0012BC3D2D|nr:transporter substrate-binding domain-containing protein [Xanthovirga aplysinae]MTI33244.1 transporter substrate-binding domain-containing protein [Xanthovirga aplysinae]
MKVILVFALSLCLIGNALPQNMNSTDSIEKREPNRHLVFGGIVNHPPFSYLDQDGNPRGFVPDLLNALGEELGFTIDFVIQEWPKTHYEFKRDSAFDLIELYFSPKRENYAVFSEPLLYINYRIVIRKNSSTLSNLDQLNNKEILVMEHTAVFYDLRRNFKKAKIFTCSGELKALQLLASGKHDVAIVKEFTAQRIPFEPDLQNLRITGPPIFPIPFNLAAHAWNPSLIQEINEGIETLREKGIYSKIYSKWLSVFVPLEARAKIKQINLLRIGLGAILLTLLIATFWILTLRKMVKGQTKALKLELVQRKQTMNILTSTNKKLKQTNKELDKFVYSISHDINAPIASITGLVQLMKYESVPKPLQEYFPKIDKSLNSLKTYIHEILDFSRNTRIKLSYQQINFQELLRETLDLLQFIPERGKISINQEIQEEYAFFSDNYRLKVLLNNLLSNALKYADSEKEKSYIKIKINTYPENCLICIKDNGIGIPKDRQEKIFEMFYRASETSQGAGIGLYIVREVLLKLKGTIEVTSKEGEGSTFILKIPNKKSAYEEEEMEEEGI